ncbi:MAG TPA: hypothetical protein VIG71_08765 [Enteractinococcus sp.]
MYAHLTATLEGAGIGLLPDFVADQHSGFVSVLDQQFAHSATFWVVLRHESLHNPAVATIYQGLQDYASGDPSSFGGGSHIFSQ